MCEKVEIFTVCLAAHEADIIHGEWIDASQDVTVIKKAIDALLMTSPVTTTGEFIIQDSVGTFGYALLQPDDTVCQAHSIACFLHKHREIGAALLAYVECNVEQATCIMQDGYYGKFATELDYVKQRHGVETPLTNTYAHTLWRELTDRGYFSIDIDNQVHIFKLC